MPDIGVILITTIVSDELMMCVKICWTGLCGYVEVNTKDGSGR